MAIDKAKLAAIVGADNVSADPALLASFAQGGGGLGRRARPHRAPALERRGQGIGEAGPRGRPQLGLLPPRAPPRLRGDTVPAGEAVMVDLSGMDKMVRVDRRNKVALIEPGVTFERLIPRWMRPASRCSCRCFPSAGKSVLASALEREPITIPKYHWDMTDPLLCTELVFGTGDLFRTGSAAGPGSLEQQWAAGRRPEEPHGPGPDRLRARGAGLAGHHGRGHLVLGQAGGQARASTASTSCRTESSARLIDFTYRVLRPKLADELLILNACAAGHA